jgi:hypothetical protein
LLISNKAFDKPSSGAKTLGSGNTQRKFIKCFQKPWDSSYPTEMFSKMVLTKMEDKGDGGFYMTLVITKCSLRTINPCSHITPVWDGA